MHLTNKCIYAQLRCICLFIGFTVNSFSVSHTLIAIQRNCTLSLIYIITDSIMHTLIWCMVFSHPDALYLAAGVWTSLLLLPSPNPHVISHHPPRLGLNEGGSLAGDHGCTWSHVAHLVHVSLTVEGILCLLYLHHLFRMCFCTTLNCFYFFSVLNTATESVLNTTAVFLRKCIVKFEQTEKKND